jgi:arylsulfatase A-like enzyme
LLIFVSDHGDFVGEYGLVRKGPEVPEVLMRVPMIWNGPGVRSGLGPGSRRGDIGREPHPAHVSIIDIFPTLCEAVGVDLPEGVQGRSVWPLLSGGDYPAEEFQSIYAEQGMGGLHYTDDTEIIDPTRDGLLDICSFDELNSRSQSGMMRMIRKGDWKLDFDMQGSGQLHNLASDPVELHNLYGSPETASLERELLAELLAWSIRADDPLPLPNGRYRMKKDRRNWYADHR